MHVKMNPTVVITSCLVIFSSFVASQSVVIETESGKIQGENLGTVNIWRSIPFAEPPVDELRFRAPVPIKPWEGIKEVTGIPNTCVQDPNPIAKYDFFEGSKIDEDCLYLSVVAPNPPLENAAVLFMLIGDGNTFGSIAQKNYNFTRIVDQGQVILVTPQFRLGPFGMLYSGTDDAPGNQLVRDQMLAFEWVQKNIAKFGGDPKRITLMGQSSSAVSGFYLLSNDDLKQAILMSGSATNDMSTQEQSDGINSMNSFSRKLSCFGSSTEEKIACMKKKEAWDLLIQSKDIWLNLVHDPEIDVHRSTDIINLIPDVPKKKIIIGGVSDEASLYISYLYPQFFNVLSNKTNISKDDFLNIINGWFFSWMGQEHRDLIVYFYENWDENDSPKIRDSLVRLFSDRVYDCGVDKLTELSVKAGWDVYRYIFVKPHQLVDPYVHGDWVGTYSGSDFSNLFCDPNELKGDGYDEDLAEDMMAYFTNFIQNGDPNRASNGSNPQWDKYDNKNMNYLEFDSTIEPKTKTPNDRCKLWYSLIPYMSLRGQEERCSLSGSTESTGTSIQPSWLHVGMWLHLVVVVYRSPLSWFSTNRR